MKKRIFRDRIILIGSLFFFLFAVCVYFYVVTSRPAFDVARGGVEYDCGAVGEKSGQPQIILESKININGADVDELCDLPGIGPKKARAILEYRNLKGPFKEPEDLMKVKGIGKILFEKISHRISVE